MKVIGEKTLKFKKKLVSRIRELRDQLNMNQKDLADLLGVSRQTIYYLEKGSYNPSLSLSFKISKVFNKSIEESKEAVKKTQDSLFDFMSKLLNSKSDLEESKISAQSKSESDQVELKKVRSKIWIKIISALIGSGGLIYFFVDIVGNLAGK